MKAQSRTSSTIITAFTQAKQDLQLTEAKNRFSKLTTNMKKRRDDLEKLQEKEGKKKKKVEVVDASKAEKFKTMDDHKIDLSELILRLETNVEKGLTKAAADQKILTIGKNVLSEKKKTPWPIKLAKEFIGFFGILLMIGGGLCFLAYGLSPSDPSTLYLGVVLYMVNFMTGGITFFQNAKSEALMEAFKNFIPPQTTVIRDGETSKIQATDLVPGDIVIVELGTRIPADLRILLSQDMKVDNSSLTGESLLMQRSILFTHESPLETKNLAFFGTLCKEGSGVGVVIFTGDKTVIGQIANLASSAGAGESPLRQELDRFITIIASIAVIIGTLFFILGFIVGYDAITNLIFAVGIIVGFVPEALLATVTVALTLTAKKLAGEKVLVKNLEGVETLGSTSCICSDKTGTLTQNKMTVEHLWYNDKKIRGPNKQKMGDKHSYQYDTKEIGFSYLHESAIICSDAQFDKSLPQDQIMKINADDNLNIQQRDAKIKETQIIWQRDLNKVPWLEQPTIGDATETALIKFFQPINDILETRLKFPACQDIEGKPARMPFNSLNKYAFLIVEQKTPDSFYCLYSKGAPERIWANCVGIYENGEVVSKSNDYEKSYSIVNEQFGKEGERVLGFAKLHLPKDKFHLGYKFDLNNFNFPFTQQIFVGLISVIDPPKDSVPYSVIKCKTAGIQVIMVTGDQPVTAGAIARQCNIIWDKTANELVIEEGISFEEAVKQSKAIIIHGDLLTKMAIDDEGLPESEKGRQLAEWVSKPQVVFARTSPAQKLIIVAACQKLGHIVAVTGDGVNDSPAIKKADIGIAMGITGSDVAKDAADMILLNDDFSSIVIGIEEGRKIFDNLKKVIAFIMISNIAEVWPFLALILVQFPLPLSTVLILIIDLGSNLVPSTAMVFEEAELDIMTRNPRRQDEHLVTIKMLLFGYLQFGTFQSATGFLQWYIILNDFGIPANQIPLLNGLTGKTPKRSDFFDPNSPWLGNTNLKDAYIANGGACQPSDMNNFEMVDWLYRIHDFADLRQMIVTCTNGKWVQNVAWGPCNVNQISPITNRPVCYSTELNKYGQTGFYFGLVVNQYSGYFVVQTLKLSIIQQGIKNYFIYFGFFVNFWILACLSYFESLYYAFGSRDLIFQHYGICAIPLGITMLLWNELRRYLIRNTAAPKAGMPNWWTRCVCQ